MLDKISRRFMWLLPAAFLIHDLEELISMPGWFAAHRAVLEELARGSSIATQLVRSAPNTFGGFAGAIGALFISFVLVTWLASARPRRLELFLYQIFLGGFLLHGFIHLAQGMIFREYTPGLVTSPTVVIPVSLYIFAHLIKSGMTTIYTFAAAAIAGILLFVPAMLLIFQML